MGARFWSRFWFCRSLNLNLDFLVQRAAILSWIAVLKKKWKFERKLLFRFQAQKAPEFFSG